MLGVIAALSRKQKAGQISEEARDSSIQNLKGDWARFVQIQVSDEIIERAARLAREFALRGADAVHLASALSVAESPSGSEHHLILVTCDRGLSRAAEG
jgi:predicted nucleic acid-binding protein